MSAAAGGAGAEATGVIEIDFTITQSEREIKKVYESGDIVYTIELKADYLNISNITIRSSVTKPENTETTGGRGAGTTNATYTTAIDLNYTVTRSKDNNIRLRIYNLRNSEKGVFLEFDKLEIFTFDYKYIITPPPFTSWHIRIPPSNIEIEPISEDAILKERTKNLKFEPIWIPRIEYGAQCPICHVQDKSSLHHKSDCPNRYMSVDYSTKPKETRLPSTAGGRRRRASRRTVRRRPTRRTKRRT